MYKVMLTTGKAAYATNMKLAGKKICNFALSIHLVLVILDLIPCLKSLLT